MAFASPSSTLNSNTTVSSTPKARSPSKVYRIFARDHPNGMHHSYRDTIHEHIDALWHDHKNLFDSVQGVVAEVKRIDESLTIQLRRRRCCDELCDEKYYRFWDSKGSIQVYFDVCLRGLSALSFSTFSQTFLYNYALIFLHFLLTLNH